MYMSYCRFEGTHQELRACLEDVEEHIQEEAEYKVSENEIEHFQNMVRDFYSWLVDYELITEDGELDEEMLERACEYMRKSYREEE